MDEERYRETDPRETIEGPGGSRLAPEGNSKARLFVPPAHEEPREEPDSEEREGRTAGAEPTDGEPEKRRFPVPARLAAAAAAVTLAAAGVLGAARVRARKQSGLRRLRARLPF